MEKKKMCDKCNKKHANTNVMDNCMERICWLIEHKTDYLPLASCCGHGKYPITVVVSDRRGKILEYFSMIEIPRKRKFYKKDEFGLFYIPELN